MCFCYVHVGLEGARRSSTGTCRWCFGCNSRTISSVGTLRCKIGTMSSLLLMGCLLGSMSFLLPIGSQMATLSSLWTLGCQPLTAFSWKVPVCWGRGGCMAKLPVLGDGQECAKLESLRDEVLCTQLSKEKHLQTCVTLALSLSIYIYISLSLSPLGLECSLLPVLISPLSFSLYLPLSLSGSAWPNLVLGLSLSLPLPILLHPICLCVFLWDALHSMSFVAVF